VGVATRCRPGSPRPDIGGGEIFCVLLDRPRNFTQLPVQWVPGLFLEVKRPERGAVHTPASNTVLRMGCLSSNPLKRKRICFV
jgi:hypothetical protein